jgi:hypothetical protein
MTANTFTPGPWRLWNSALPSEPVEIIDQNGDFICTVAGANTQSKANGLLLTAAPELYASLKAALHLLHEHCGTSAENTDAYWDAVKALRKADGTPPAHPADIERAMWKSEKGGAA